jgi:hypothetical protein
VHLEKCLDELWMGVKGQSNLAIAGSPRNILRYSLDCFTSEVKLLDGLGSLQAYQTQPNSECRD